MSIDSLGNTSIATFRQMKQSFAQQRDGSEWYSSGLPLAKLYSPDEIHVMAAALKKMTPEIGTADPTNSSSLLAEMSDLLNWLHNEWKKMLPDEANEDDYGTAIATLRVALDGLRRFRTEYVRQYWIEKIDTQP